MTPSARFLALFSLSFTLALAQTDTYSVVPFAGATRPTGDGGPAVSALLNAPRGIVTDAFGNTFFSDEQNHRVRKIDKNGIITTFAGTGVRGSSGDGGPAAKAQLLSPYGLALDGTGNLYIADFDANVIRRVAPDGTISTFAGSGRTGYSGDGGPSTAAQLSSPAAVAVDAAGNLFIADTDNSRIRKVTPLGIISTVAGNGSLSFTPSGGPGPQITVVYPEGLLFDSAGNLYISEWGYSRVLKMSPAGVVSVVAGTGFTGFTGDSGAALNATFNGPQGLALDSAGNLYIADSENRRIRRVSNGIVSTVAGSGGIGFGGDNFSAGGAQLFDPFGVAIDSSGNLLIADTQNHRIRKVNLLSNIITTIAGAPASIGDGGPATSALLFEPAGLAVDNSFNVYIADQSNHRVRKITPAGVVSTVAGNGSPGFSGDGTPATSAQLFFPLGVAIDPQGNLLIADTGNNRIRRVAANGNIQTIAGIGREDFSGDGGLATLAALAQPSAVKTDAAGNIYISDTVNNRIRKVTPAGNINTYVGSNNTALGDGGPASSANLLAPGGIALDSANNLYIADTFNSRIRKVTAAGIITTIAGTGNLGFTGDGGPAASANLFLPLDVAADAAGNLYITDTYNARIRKVTPAGVISTVAGTGRFSISGDNGPAIQADLGVPFGIAVDSTGAVYFTDADNHKVRELVRPTAVQDFTFTSSIQTVSVNRGSSVSVSLTLLSAGIAGPVTLAAKNFTAGTVTFSPSASATLAPGQTTTVQANVSFPVTAPAGPVTLTLTADSGAVHHELTLNLTVVDVPLITSNGIVNAAGYNKGAVSPGEIVTIFGSGIGPATLATYQLDASGNFLSTVAGVTVTFDGHPAPILYVSATQLSAIVPYSVAGQASTQLRIQYQGTPSSPMTVPVTDAVPALFTADSSGAGPIAALNQDSSPNAPANPAAKGSIVVLFGTGEGQTSPAGVDGAVANSVYPAPVLPVTVSIGGANADVLYAGAAPGLVAGVIQINVRVPAATPSGAVPIALTVGTKSSTPGLTLSVQ